MGRERVLMSSKTLSWDKRCTCCATEQTRMGDSALFVCSSFIVTHCNSRPPSSQTFLFVSYSTPDTRFLTFFYDSLPPFTLQTLQKSLQLFPRFLNLPSYPRLLLLQLFQALPLLALSVLLAFGIPTFSILLLTFSVIASITLSISLSLPTVLPYYSDRTFSLMHTAYDPITSFSSLVQSFLTILCLSPLSPKTHLAHAIFQSPDVSTYPSSSTS